MDEDSYANLYWHVAHLAMWRQAVDYQVGRIREFAITARSEVDRGESRTSARLETEMHFLLVAVVNVLRMARGISRLTGSQDVDAAIAEFLNQESGSVTDFRNLAEHMDDYILGRGRTDLDPRRMKVSVDEDGSVAFAVGDDLEDWPLPSGVPFVSSELAAEKAVHLATRTQAVVRELFEAQDWWQDWVSREGPHVEFVFGM